MSTEFIHFCGDLRVLTLSLTEKLKPHSRIIVLCDENTASYCLPLIAEPLNNATIISIKAGEEYKNLNACEYIWSKLTELNADRHALLVNIGGGVVSDIGGFAAACYKRGIAYINIPTTLLAMVDAAIGGKTGIDLEHFKNQIGIFNPAESVFICTDFLKTLPHKHIKAGMAEVVKHYLIADAAAFQSIYEIPTHIELPLIQLAVAIKSAIVAQDPLDKGIRKLLNFGHTIGHALESYQLNIGSAILHGEAIAIGMVIETIISGKMGLLVSQKMDFIFNKLNGLFDLTLINEIAIADVISLMIQDKKNSNDRIKMVLPIDIGKCTIDNEVTHETILSAITTYNAQLTQ